MSWVQLYEGGFRMVCPLGSRSVLSRGVKVRFGHGCFVTYIYSYCFRQLFTFQHLQQPSSEALTHHTYSIACCRPWHSGASHVWEWRGATKHSAVYVCMYV